MKFLSPNQNWESESERLESRIRELCWICCCPRKKVRMLGTSLLVLLPQHPSHDHYLGIPADTIHRDKGGLGAPRGHFTLEHLRLQAGERAGQRGGLKQTREKTHPFRSGGKPPFVDCGIRVFQLQFLEEKVIVFALENHFLVCGSLTGDP